jgi:VWFA-related protein
MSRPAVIAAGCLSVILTLSVSAEQAQQPPPGQTPVFRSRVDLIHLDVSVLDKDRRPVRGLTDKDFTITEDSLFQPIVAFSAVDVPETLPKPAVWSGRAPADVQSNDGAGDPEGRLFVLLLDDALIPPDPDALKSARDVARKFLDKVTPVDRVAIVFSNAGRNQDFTNDRARLLKAIETMKSGSALHLGGWDTAKDPNPAVVRGVAELPDLSPPGPVMDPDIIFRQASMQTLRQVAETLISSPQRRKALVFISPGIAIDDTGAAAPVATLPIKSDNVTPPDGDPRGGLTNTRMALIDANRQLAHDLTPLFDRMKRANVTIYPIDPCGNGGYQKYVLQQAMSVPLLQQNNEANRRAAQVGLANRAALDANPNAVLANTTDLSGPPPPFFSFLNPGAGVPTPGGLAQYMSTLSKGFLESAASNTGGRPVVNTNDFDAALDQIFDENSSYYLLGYQQPPNQRPGSIHHIKVMVNRPGVFVRTRNGYATADAPTTNSKKKANSEPQSPLDQAIVNAVPEGALPMRVALAPFALPGKKDPTVTIALGLSQPPVTTRSVFTVDLQTNAYTVDGRPKFVGLRHTATVTLVPTADKGPARYDLLAQISLPPGRYQLRLSANRAADGVIGSLYADLEVPDFTAALEASGVVVETVPALATAPIGAFDAFLPVVPSTSREFTAKQDVTAFMRIYQGGTGSAKPVEVKTRIVNEADAEVVTGKGMIYGPDFRVGGRAADYRFPIPVKVLPAGLYLLTFDIVLDGNVVQRSVQFKVVR